MGDSRGGRGRAGCIVRSGLAVIGLIAVALAVCCHASYMLDCASLRRIAEREAPDTLTSSQRVLALTHWVYLNRGFSENHQYFVWPRLRATPMQVLDGGGDCADKSRLLTAMLREIGIDSTMVMCFDSRTGSPTHTVVEAKIASDAYMVVDPVYRLWFPKAGNGGYHDLLDLRADSIILERRLDELLVDAPRRSRLRSYQPSSASYVHATSINWNRNFITRSIGRFIRWRIGDGVYRLPRPPVLEEPKLFVSAVLAGIALSSLAATLILARMKTRRVIPVAAWSNLACGH